MTEEEKKILKTIYTTVPKMNTLQKEKFLSFGEGMAYMMEEHAKEIKSYECKTKNDEGN